MKPGSSTLKYLANFLNTIESYIHPANMGYWIGNIEKVLMSVVKNFMDRIKDERYRKPSWIREIPGNIIRYKLPPIEISITELFYFRIA